MSTMERRAAPSTRTAGAEMVAAATRFADDFAAGAMAHDRDGTFAVEHLEKLQRRPASWSRPCRASSAAAA